MARRSLFIVNPTAGAGRAGALWARFKRQLALVDSSAEATLTEGAGEATLIAREAATRYQQIIAVGGDGTVSEVAEGILGTAQPHCALGILPLGTGNDIAQTVGIHNVDDTVASLAINQVSVIDVIEIHYVRNAKPAQRHAVLFAGAGIVSAVLRNTTPLAKRILGQAGAYRAALVRALWGYHSPHMRITCDGAITERRCLFIGVSNGRIAGGGMRIAPGARLDDGMLNVNLVDAVSGWEALKQLRRLSQGTHTTHPAVRYFPARNISLESDALVEIAVDGEIIGHTPAAFVIKPKALPILMGRSE